MKKIFQYLFLISVIPLFSIICFACAPTSSDENNNSTIETKLNLKDCTINTNGNINANGESHNSTYDGEEIRVNVTKLYFKSKKIDVDLSKCTFTYKDNINVGTATLTITSSEYDGEYVYTYTISQATKTIVYTGDSTDIDSVNSFLNNENYKSVTYTSGADVGSLQQTISSNKNIAIPENKTLILEDIILTNNATITVNGTLQIGQTYSSYIINTNDSKIINNNTIGMYDNCYIYLKQGSQLENNGSISNNKKSRLTSAAIYYDDTYEYISDLLDDEKIIRNGRGMSTFLDLNKRTDVSKLLENNQLNSLIYFTGGTNSKFSKYVETQNYLTYFTYKYTGEEILPGLYDEKNDKKYELKYSTQGYYTNQTNYIQWYLGYVGQIVPITEDRTNIGTKKFKIVMNDLNTQFYGEIELEYIITPQTINVYKIDSTNDTSIENIKDNISNYNITLSCAYDENTQTTTANIKEIKNANLLKICYKYIPKNNSEIKAKIILEGSNSELKLNNTISFSNTSSITLKSNAKLSFKETTASLTGTNNYSDLSSIINNGDYAKGNYTLTFGDKTITLIIE